MSTTTEAQVLGGALARFRSEGFDAGHYFPEGRAQGYCAIGGLMRAAGAAWYSCRPATRTGSEHPDMNRQRFFTLHPEVARAHARLEANLGMTREELFAEAGWLSAESCQESLTWEYGDSLLEFWAEECHPVEGEVIALFERALAEARADEAAQLEPALA